MALGTGGYCLGCATWRGVAHGLHASVWVAMRWAGIPQRTGRCGPKKSCGESFPRSSGTTPCASTCLPRTLEAGCRGGSFCPQTPGLSNNSPDTPTSRAGTGLAQVIPGLSTQQGIPGTKEFQVAVTVPSAPGQSQPVLVAMDLGQVELVVGAMLWRLQRRLVRMFALTRAHLYLWKQGGWQGEPEGPQGGWTQVTLSSRGQCLCSLLLAPLLPNFTVLLPAWAPSSRETPARCSSRTPHCICNEIFMEPFCLLTEELL